ncbi:hypothetical protein HPP92_000374 [Vanilla planifolia]|uniref:Uncharacterized protein n=1 Tax=Vanilla planifolia TaxID=51239 RepID=A0A835VFW3_VANPL|nr:hypothetical protein HPP92_000374 [Vanilla planifolia]
MAAEFGRTDNLDNDTMVRLQSLTKTALIVRTFNDKSNLIAVEMAQTRIRTEDDGV